MVERGDFPIDPTAVPFDENGARHLRAAAALMLERTDAFREDWPIFGAADWPEFGVGLKAAQIDILAQMVELNRDGYATMESSHSYSAFDFDPDRDLSLQQQLVILGDMRRLARWLQIRHWLLAARGDSNGAAQTVDEVFLIARSLRQDDALIFSLVDISITALGYGLIEETLSRNVLPDDALAQMQRALMTAVDRPDILVTMTQGAQRDLAQWLDPDAALNRTLNRGVYVEDTLDEIRRALHEVLTDTAYESVEAWWYRLIERLGFAYFRVCPGSLQLGLVEEYHALLTAAQQVADEGRVDPAFAQECEENEIYTPNAIEASLRTFNQAQTLVRCHIYGVQAERHRLREGTWPTSIQEIRIEAFPPVDAWGNPLAVTRTEQGFKVYSFGDNGQDDGGLGRWDEYDRDDYPGGEPDDWNMALLDPQVRGRLGPRRPADDPGAIVLPPRRGASRKRPRGRRRPRPRRRHRAGI